ncbi:MAG: nucleotidyltransferase domain-containing protein, partial [Clostridia bacterium]|nr:nucleotidyltransferase domain-containing protein [Clostridia bacterium]
MVILKKLRRNIDYRIEPHLIEVADFDNIETPFVQEV